MKPPHATVGAAAIVAVAAFIAFAVSNVVVFGLLGFLATVVGFGAYALSTPRDAPFSPPPDVRRASKPEDPPPPGPS
ncbi:MAG: hypothetical protein H0X42_01335 [Solirubrobacterales bacterium]|nr:hypothetical protein [Solirubrobacterales bacterium]